MVLLLLYLYGTLPQLVPKTTVDFAGKLGDKQVSFCVLHNMLRQLYDLCLCLLCASAVLQWCCCCCACCPLHACTHKLQSAMLLQIWLQRVVLLCLVSRLCLTINVPTQVKSCTICLHCSHDVSDNKTCVGSHAPPDCFASLLGCTFHSAYAYQDASKTSNQLLSRCSAVLAVYMR